MKKTLILISVLLFNAILLSAQSSSKTLLTLDKYLIPVNEKGAVIGKIITQPGIKVTLAKDTSKLFTIDKQGYITLKKGKELTSTSPFRYEITLKYGKEKKAFELVKDEFIRNKVIAHRGAWKHHEASHNSMRSLKKAIELGCEGSELDFWLSSDNVLVLSHDPSIGGKKVEETTAEELYKIPLKSGDFVPSLEEYINYVKTQNKTRLVLEIKGSQIGKAIADSTVQLVHRMKAQAWVDYIAFGLEYMVRVKELDPTATVQYLGSNKTLEELKAANMSGIDFNQKMYLNDPELVSKAKKLGFITNVWTVNKEEDMRTLLQQGVDYITTDEPELLLKIISE